MYLDPAKITFLKAKIVANEEPYKAHWLAIKASADASLLVTPPAPTDPIVTDPDQEGPFRFIGNRLPALALAYLITDDITYLNGAKVWMDALVSYDHWHGDESLGAAHSLYNMAIAYDWLYTDLTGGERTTYETKIALHTKIFYDAMNRSPPVWWKTNYNGNHNYIDVGAMMTSAVALYDVMPEADTYVHQAYDNFTHVLGSTILPPDGTSQEGISYWSYGMEALLRYFELEKEMFGANRALTSLNIQNLPFYRLYGGMPNYWQTITMGDGRNWDYYGPTFILMRVASLFNDQMAQWLAQKINDKRASSGFVGIDSDWRTLLWYDESVGKQDVFSLPTYRLFPTLGLFTSRSSWTDDNAFMFALKAGPPGGHGMMPAGGHVHPDEGGFTLRDFSKDLVIDDEYSYLKSTSNHNVPTFDGGIGQLGEGSIWFNSTDVLNSNGTADIIYTDFDDTKGYEYLVADLADIYKPGLGITKFLRHFILLKKGTLVIIDEIESGSDHQIEWRLHLNHDSTFAINGQTLSGTIDGTDVGLVADDISEEAHTYSLGKETVTASGDGTTSTFNSNTFQLSKTGHAWKIETVLRPFQGTAPSALEYTRKDGYLVLKLGDDSYSAIDTTSRKVLMNVNPNNIDGIASVTSDGGGSISPIYSGGSIIFSQNSIPTNATSTAQVQTNQPTPSLPHSFYTFTKNLSLHDTGEDVKALQQFLNISVTGYFGLATYTALVQYQKSEGLTPSGYLGPTTRAHIATIPFPSFSYTFTKNLSLHDTGEDVKALQQFLNTKGYNLSVTGYFGMTTYYALVAYQKSVGLPQMGWLGPETRAKLVSLAQ
jgi:peptidoglycan hydrolase-like protein with peptidoglycan-binding domain